MSPYKTHLDEDEMEVAQSKLSNLLELNEGLTSKELNFICQLDEEWKGAFTIGQLKYIEIIWSKKFES